MNKFTLTTAILQFIGGLALIGISVYYYFVQNMTNFYVFLAVGILFVLLPVRTFYKLFSKKKKDDNEPKDGGKKSFL